MALKIHTTIALESCGGDEETLEAYAAWLQDTLLLRWPEAAVTIETTTRDSGVMPLVIDGATREEEDAITAEIDAAWEDFCSNRNR
jgi:hypothetical protein